MFVLFCCLVCQILWRISFAIWLKCYFPPCRVSTCTTAPAEILLNFIEILLKFYWNFTEILLECCFSPWWVSTYPSWILAEILLKFDWNVASLFGGLPLLHHLLPSLCSTTPIINSTAWVQCALCGICALCSINWNMPVHCNMCQNVQYVPKCAEMCNLHCVQMCNAVRQCALLSVLQFYFMLCLWCVH